MCSRQWALGRRIRPDSLHVYAFTRQCTVAVSPKVCNFKPTTQFRLPAETRSSYGRNRNLAETPNLASFGAVTETEIPSALTDLPHLKLVPISQSLKACLSSTICMQHNERHVHDSFLCIPKLSIQLNGGIS